MKLKSLLVVISSALVAIGVFLPWYSASFMGYSASANGLTGDIAGFGVVILLLAIVMIIMSAVSIKKDLSKAVKITDTVLAAITLLVAILVTSVAQQYSFGGISGVGFGLILIIIASIATIVLPWVKIDKALGEEAKPAKKTTKE